MYFASIISRLADNGKVYVTNLSDLPDEQDVAAYFFPEFDGQKHFLVIQNRSEDKAVCFARLTKDGEIDEVDRVCFEKALLKPGYYAITGEKVYFYSPDQTIEVEKQGGFAKRQKDSAITNREIADLAAEAASAVEGEKSVAEEKSVSKKILDDSTLFEFVRDKLVVVQCDDASGSGFVCEMDGKKYMVTNKHVIEGQSRVSAMFSDGKELKLGKLDIAGNADLVRFSVPETQSSLKLRADEPKMNERIFVFGNSDGESVLTDLNGQIIGIGADKLEVTAKFVHGNSGSAVLDESGEVVGVATYATKASGPKDWVKEDSRFSEVRRFALRIRDIQWIKTDLKAFKRKCDAAEEIRKKRLGILPEVQASFKSPSLRVNKDATKYSEKYYINGNIALNLSSRDCKNPVVRVVFLVSCGSVRYVFDAIAVKSGGIYEYRSVPVYSYGMKNTGWYWMLDASSKVYYLEGLSYHQRHFSGHSAKGIEYFDRSSMLRSGFTIPIDLTKEGGEPKILAYRFECWQNGSLAAVYNSVRPQTLNSRGIPVDWFVLWKYPKLFYYPELRAEVN